MGHWNHRVMKRMVDSPIFDDELTPYYTIHEVYYDDNGNIENFTKNPTCPSGETLEELKESYQLYAKAFEKEVLDYNQLSKEFDDG